MSRRMHEFVGNVFVMVTVLLLAVAIQFWQRRQWWELIGCSVAIVVAVLKAFAHRWVSKEENEEV